MDTKSRMTRIGLAAMALVGVMILSLAVFTGTSSAQGPDDRPYAAEPRNDGYPGNAPEDALTTQERQQLMDPTGILEPLLAQEQARLQNDVAAGRLTQAQADNALRQYAQNLDLIVASLPAASEAGLSSPALVALFTGIQDEYHAYNTYQAIIDQFGAVRPFTSIQASEAQHIALLEAMFERYDIPVPGALPLDPVPSFDSLSDACAAAAEAEVANFDLYDLWLDQVSEYPDLVDVFTMLRDASEFNHLPAFERCAS